LIGPSKKIKLTLHTPQNGSTKVFLFGPLYSLYIYIYIRKLNFGQNICHKSVRWKHGIVYQTLTKTIHKNLNLVEWNLWGFVSTPFLVTMFLNFSPKSIYQGLYPKLTHLRPGLAPKYLKTCQVESFVGSNYCSKSSSWA